MTSKLLRLKQNIILRNMSAETVFVADQLIQPIFISEKVSEKKTIPGLGNNYVLNLKDGIKQIENDLKNNCRNFLLFTIPRKKSSNNFSSKGFKNSQRTDIVGNSNWRRRRQPSRRFHQRHQSRIAGRRAH